jgi:hypothetical protein
MTYASKQWMKMWIRLLVVTCFVVYGYCNLDTAPPVERPIAVGSPVQLTEGFDCWASGDHGMPTHVIYHTGGNWKIGGTKAVDKAFKQIFDHQDNGMTIYRFCKG